MAASDWRTSWGTPAERLATAREQLKRNCNDMNGGVGKSKVEWAGRNEIGPLAQKGSVFETS